MKNLTWALIVLFTTGFALGCGGSSDDEPNNALSSDLNTSENEEAAQEEGETEAGEKEATAGEEEEATAGEEEEATADEEEEATAGGEEEAAAGGEETAGGEPTESSDNDNNEFIDCVDADCGPSSEYICADGESLSTWEAYDDSVECDGVKDCKDGSDEAGCQWYICADGVFLGGADEPWECNGVIDCEDGSDEENCPGEDDQEAAAGGEEAEESGDPCDFVGPIGVEGEEDPELTWTSATLEEGSDAKCPDNEQALGFLNEDDEEDEGDEGDEGDEEDEGDEDDCEPVQKTDVDTCTFSLECDGVTAEFTATEDGNVVASFSVVVESEDGSASVECNYAVTGTVTLPE